MGKKASVGVMSGPLPGTAVLVCGDIRGQVHIVMAPGLETGRASKPSARTLHYHHHHHSHSVKKEGAVIDPLQYLEKRKKRGAMTMALKTAFAIRGQLKKVVLPTLFSRSSQAPGPNFLILIIAP